MYIFVANISIVGTVHQENKVKLVLSFTFYSSDYIKFVLSLDKLISKVIKILLHSTVQMAEDFKVAAERIETKQLVMRRQSVFDREARDAE